MSEKYRVVSQGRVKWVSKPGNGGELPFYPEEVRDELNTLIVQRDAAQKELADLKASLAQCQFGCFDRTEHGWIVDGFVHEGLGGYIPGLERPEGGDDE